MNVWKKWGLLPLLLTLFSLSLFAEGEDDNAPDIRVVPRGAVIDDDYFAWENSVEIAGTINGDLYLFGSQVFIDGVVKGDVLAVGGNINIAGSVLQDVRVMGGQLTVSGSVGGSLTALAGNCEIASPASIGRNLLLVSGNADVAGAVQGTSRFYCSNLRLADSIGRNVLAYVGTLRVASTANIGGALEYWSDNVAVVDPTATIREGITHHASFIYNLSKHPFLKWLRIGSKLATVLMNFFYSLVLGIIFMKYYPRKLERSLKAMNEKPLQALITGVIVLVLLPLVSLLLLMTILGVPFALTLLAVNVIGFYTAKVFSILWVSEKLFQKLRFQKFRNFIYLGLLIVYFLLTAIPYLGTLVAAVAMLFGLGAIVLGRTNERLIEKGT